MTILFYSNRPSNGLNNLKNAINEAFPNSAVRLMATMSNRNVRSQDLLVNWGCSDVSIPASNLRNMSADRYLNKPAAVAKAANKKITLELLQRANVPTVEWTPDQRVAQNWLETGAIVYSRTRLSGHSGEGIVISFNNPATVGDAGNNFTVRSDLPSAPLYTKGVMGQRREWRVHVMKGQVFHVQQKKRANGFEQNESYSNLVRNHSTGWIYATSDITLPAGVGEIAVRATNALGLDFGAVDIVTRQGSTYVLEVNTACGQEAGQTLDAYKNALVAVHNNTAIPAAVIVQSSSDEAESETSAPQPAVAPSRDVDSLLAQGQRAYDSIRHYIRTTSFLRFGGISYTYLYTAHAERMWASFIRGVTEASLATVENKFNRLKAAIRRFAETVTAVVSRYSSCSARVRMRVQLGSIETLALSTAAEITEFENTHHVVRRIQDAISAAQEAIQRETTLARTEAPAAPVAREAERQVATTETSNVLSPDQSLEIANNFADWLAAQTRSTGRPASQIISVLRSDFRL